MVADYKSAAPNLSIMTRRNSQAKQCGEPPIMRQVTSHRDRRTMSGCFIVLPGNLVDDPMTIRWTPGVIKYLDRIASILFSGGKI